MSNITDALTELELLIGAVKAPPATAIPGTLEARIAAIEAAVVAIAEAVKAFTPPVTTSK